MQPNSTQPKTRKRKREALSDATKEKSAKQRKFGDTDVDPVKAELDESIEFADATLHVLRDPGCFFAADEIHSDTRTLLDVLDKPGSRANLERLLIALGNNQLWHAFRALRSSDWLDELARFKQIDYAFCTEFLQRFIAAVPEIEASYGNTLPLFTAWCRDVVNLVLRYTDSFETVSTYSQRLPEQARLVKYDTRNKPLGFDYEDGSNAEFRHAVVTYIESTSRLQNRSVLLAAWSLLELTANVWDVLQYQLGYAVVDLITNRTAALKTREEIVVCIDWLAAFCVGSKSNGSVTGSDGVIAPLEPDTAGFLRHRALRSYQPVGDDAKATDSEVIHLKSSGAIEMTPELCRLFFLNHDFHKPELMSLLSKSVLSISIARAQIGSNVVPLISNVLMHSLFAKEALRGTEFERDTAQQLLQIDDSLLNDDDIHYSPLHLPSERAPKYLPIHPESEPPEAFDDEVLAPEFKPQGPSINGAASAAAVAVGLNTNLEIRLALEEIAKGRLPNGSIPWQLLHEQIENGKCNLAGSQILLYWFDVWYAVRLVEQEFVDLASSAKDRWERNSYQIKEYSDMARLLSELCSNLFDEMCNSQEAQLLRDQLQSTDEDFARSLTQILASKSSQATVTPLEAVSIASDLLKREMRTWDNYVQGERRDAHLAAIQSIFDASIGYQALFTMLLDMATMLLNICSAWRYVVYVPNAHRLAELEDNDQELQTKLNELAASREQERVLQSLVETPERDEKYYRLLTDYTALYDRLQREFDEKLRQWEEGRRQQPSEVRSLQVESQQERIPRQPVPVEVVAERRSPWQPVQPRVVAEQRRDQIMEENASDEGFVAEEASEEVEPAPEDIEEVEPAAEDIEAEDEAVAAEPVIEPAEEPDVEPAQPLPEQPNPRALVSEASRDDEEAAAAAAEVEEESARQEQQQQQGLEELVAAPEPIEVDDEEPASAAAELPPLSAENQQKLVAALERLEVINHDIESARQDKIAYSKEVSRSGRSKSEYDAVMKQRRQRVADANASLARLEKDRIATQTEIDELRRLGVPIRPLSRVVVKQDPDEAQKKRDAKLQELQKRLDQNTQELNATVMERMRAREDAQAQIRVSAKIQALKKENDKLKGQIKRLSAKNRATGRTRPAQAGGTNVGRQIPAHLIVPASDPRIMELAEQLRTLDRRREEDLVQQKRVTEQTENEIRSIRDRIAQQSTEADPRYPYVQQAMTHLLLSRPTLTRNWNMEEQQTPDLRLWYTLQRMLQHNAKYNIVRAAFPLDRDDNTGVSERQYKLAIAMLSIQSAWDEGKFASTTTYHPGDWSRLQIRPGRIVRTDPPHPGFVHDGVNYATSAGRTPGDHDYSTEAVRRLRLRQEQTLALTPAEIHRRQEIEAAALQRQLLETQLNTIQRELLQPHTLTELDKLQRQMSAVQKRLKRQVAPPESFKQKLRRSLGGVATTIWSTLGLGGEGEEQDEAEELERKRRQQQEIPHYEIAMAPVILSVMAHPVLAMHHADRLMAAINVVHRVNTILRVIRLFLVPFQAASRYSYADIGNVLLLLYNLSYYTGFSEGARTLTQLLGGALPSVQVVQAAAGTNAFAESVEIAAWDRHGRTASEVFRVFERTGVNTEARVVELQSTWASLASFYAGPTRPVFPGVGQYLTEVTRAGFARLSLATRYASSNTAEGVVVSVFSGMGMLNLCAAGVGVLYFGMKRDELGAAAATPPTAQNAPINALTRRALYAKYDSLYLRSVSVFTNGITLTALANFIQEAADIYVGWQVAMPHVIALFGGAAWLAGWGIGLAVLAGLGFAVYKYRNYVPKFLRPYLLVGGIVGLGGLALGFGFFSFIGSLASSVIHYGMDWFTLMCEKLQSVFPWLRLSSNNESSKAVQRLIDEHTRRYNTPKGRLVMFGVSVVNAVLCAGVLQILHSRIRDAITSSRGTAARVVITAGSFLALAFAITAGAGLLY